MRNSLAGLAAVLLGVASCGDNSRKCGPGTIEEGGYCIPAATCGFGTAENPDTGECVPDGSVVCSDGTVFDALTGSCKIDPDACQNGTVLIDDACVDPTTGLTINVQEGPEPNGLGVIEASEAQAGNISLPLGETFVVHGTLNPHRDHNNDGALDPDVDTFVLEVGGPTFIRITADGVNGTAAGFVAVAAVDDDDALASWERVGLSLVSDTSVREVLLPRGGRYHIAIADTRTLLEYVNGGVPTAAPGGPSAEYYVSLKVFSPPAPTALTLTNGRATIAQTKPSDELRLYSVALGNGLNRVQLAMPSALVEGAVVVLTNDMFRAQADEATNGPASTLVGNISPDDQTVIVVDQVYSLVPVSVGYTLDVVASTAAQLSTTGGTVMAQATTNVGTDFFRLNLFAFDVAAADATVGMQLAWSPAIVGQIYDATGTRIVTFTNPTGSASWSSFRGLVRLREPGRYYFAVYAPSASSSSQLSVTSTISELTPTAITKGTPLVAAPISTAFRAAPFTYMAGAATDPWQSFDASGVNTGGQTVSWYALDTAYGRLDPLSTSLGLVQPEVTPIFTRSFSTSGGPFGRILLNDPTDNYFVKVNAVGPTTSPTTTLTFSPRANYTDLGTLARGTGRVRTGELLDPAIPQRYYLFRTDVGNTAMITITPTSNVNTQFRRLREDETALGNLINANGPDVETFVQTGTNWTAFVVSAAGGLPGPRTFDVSVDIQ